MREKIIEQKLVNVVKSLGGVALKFISPGMSGVPDRLILLPGKRLAFVEVILLININTSIRSLFVV